MNDQELGALLADQESDRVERKESLADANRIREAICAFANDLPGHGRPGVVFVGAKDDGSCAGLRITDELLLTLASIRSDGNIHPFPSIIVQKRVLRACEMAVVIVEPSAAPPVRVRGVTRIRVGPRRDIATAEEERRLSERRRGRDLPYDIQSLPSATLDELDLDLFSRVYLPQAVDGDVLSVNRRQQLARNAILHRSYEGTNAPVRVYWFSDRIEIHSPGGPFGQVSRENFGREGLTDYRNPHLAEAMKVLGYVQRFGMGIPIARQELQRNGNPPLEFAVEAGHIMALVRRRP